MLDESVDGVTDPPDLPETQVETREEAARVRRHLAQLRTAEQQVLELSIFNGLSQSEIAELTSMPLGTVKTHARRGLLRLRKLLGVAERLATRGDPSDAGET